MEYKNIRNKIRPIQWMYDISSSYKTITVQRLATLTHYAKTTNVIGKCHIYGQMRQNEKAVHKIQTFPNKYRSLVIMGRSGANANSEFNSFGFSKITARWGHLFENIKAIVRTS